MKKSNGFLWLLLLFIYGCIVGILLMELIPDSYFDNPLTVLLPLAALPIGLLPTVLHEAGHMIFGLFCGYRFVSFRVGRVTLIRSNRKFSFRSRKIRGAGGQCLMAPPERENHPFLPYILGGVIVNLVSFPVSVVIFVLVPDVTVRILTGLFGLFSISSALINGIPVRPFGFPNDGYNAKAMLSDPAVRRAVDLQLLINEAAENGLTPEQMPRQWFDLPTKESLNDPQVIASLIFRGDYLGAVGDKDGMIDIYRYVLSLPDVLPVHKISVEANLFAAVLLYKNADPLLLSSNDFSDLMAVLPMRGNPDVSFAAYAYHALIRGDLNAAREAWQDFDKSVRNYPDGIRRSAERDMAEIQKKVYSVFDQI